MFDFVSGELHVRSEIQTSGCRGVVGDTSDRRRGNAGPRRSSGIHLRHQHGRRGVALGGYDPVAYFDGGAPTPGVDTISASYEGARHLFAREAQLKTFLANPKEYIP